MNHLVALPILFPLCTGALLLAGRRGDLRSQRGLALLSVLVQLLLAALLLERAANATEVYALGSWLPPQGIVLVLDRLSALMLLTTAMLALPVLIYACGGGDRAGKYFHALFQFQLCGINGAFLTGDLFNLFVFFEVLLIASYGLLLHGRGSARTRAGLHYVVLNLVGSALFLFAAGLLYGVAGTLNFADLSVYIAVADPADAPLLAAAGFLLLVVFGLKAALFPLHFWLPHSYAAASAPAAALFAIMTKVGVYALLRTSTLLFGTEAGALAGLLQSWLWPLALLTIGCAAIGALAARTLQQLAAYLVLLSAGTLLSALAVDGVQALTALLYYLLHSTWIGAAWFLLADLLSARRGASGGALQPGPRLRENSLFGVAFVIAAAAQAGLPPLSGFIGKIALLQAVAGPAAAWLWSSVLGAGLLTLIAVSRAGSTVFWRSVGAPTTRVAMPAGALLALGALLSSSVLLSLCGAPVFDYLRATAQQIAAPELYSAAVLSLAQPPGVQP